MGEDRVQVVEGVIVGYWACQLCDTAYYGGGGTRESSALRRVSVAAGIWSAEEAAAMRVMGCFIALGVYWLLDVQT
jgi:hypothetical protein